MTRRTVRVLNWSYRDVDRLLPPERDGRGAPSAHDFLVQDVAPVLDALADDFEAMTTPATPSSPIRVYVGAGKLVERFALFAVLSDEDVVEVVAVQLDPFA